MKANKKNSKSWVWLLLAVVVAGVIALGYSKGSTLKGQLLGQNKNVAVTGEENSLPDLEADIILATEPETGKDLQIRATVTNLGPGFINGKTPFKYSIEVNGDEVFSNTDSYTSMGQGDSFSFDYPIPRALYEYKDKGEVAFIVDTEDSLDEANEDNNGKTVQYTY